MAKEPTRVTADMLGEADRIIESGEYGNFVEVSDLDHHHWYQWVAENFADFMRVLNNRGLSYKVEDFALTHRARGWNGPLNSLAGYGWLCQLRVEA